MIERLLQRFGFHDMGMALAAVIERINICCDAFRIDPFDHLGAGICNSAIAKLDHLAKLPRRIDMQKRERDLAWVEGLARQMKQNGGVLADRIQHDWPLKLRDDLPKDLNRFGLKLLEVGQPKIAGYANQEDGCAEATMRGSGSVA